jgi:hypothetical protein
MLLKRLPLFIFLILASLALLPLPDTSITSARQAGVGANVWEVKLAPNTQAGSNITIENQCGQTHSFNVVPREAPYLRLSNTTVRVKGRSRLILPATFNTTGMRAGDYNGSVVVECETCREERTCRQENKTIPVHLLVTAVNGTQFVGSNLPPSSFTENTSAPQTVTPVKPFCTDFDDSALHGWGNGGSQVKVEIKQPGASGAASDDYFHATDQSGASWISASPDYHGNWTSLANKGCGALCWDVRLFIDGLDGGHIGDDHLCTTASGPCPANTFRPIVPSLIMISDPDGPGGNPPLRAIFRGKTFITEDGGSNPGWHHVCAPVALLSGGGNLPSNAQGAWEMLDGAPNSSWNTVLSNVTDIQFPIDFTSNPAEEVGYDNFCFRDNECPQTSECAQVTTKEIACKEGGGSYAYTFSVTNNTSKDVQQILLTPPIGSSLTFSQQVFNLSTPLHPGQSTTLSVTLGNIKQGECFFVTLMSKDGPCCTVRVCPELPDCCALITDVKIAPSPTGGYDYTFTVTNQSANPIQYIYFTPQSGVTMTSYLPVTPSLAPGGTRTFTVKINAPPSGGKVCFTISLHGEGMKDCCSVEHCIKLPGLGTPK